MFHDNQLVSRRVPSNFRLRSLLFPLSVAYPGGGGGINLTGVTQIEHLSHLLSLRYIQCMTILGRYKSLCAPSVRPCPLFSHSVMVPIHSRMHLGLLAIVGMFSVSVLCMPSSAIFGSVNHPSLVHVVLFSV